MYYFIMQLGISWIAHSFCILVRIQNIAELPTQYFEVNILVQAVDCIYYGSGDV